MRFQALYFQRHSGFHVINKVGAFVFIFSQFSTIFSGYQVSNIILSLLAIVLYFYFYFMSIYFHRHSCIIFYGIWLFKSFFGYVELYKLPEFCKLEYDTASFGTKKSLYPIFLIDVK